VLEKHDYANEVAMFIFQCVVITFALSPSHQADKQVGEHSFMGKKAAQEPAGPCDKCLKENLCAGQVGPNGGPPESGTPNCMPVVCSAICECRYCPPPAIDGVCVPLPEPPPTPPIAILPQPLPEWDKEQTSRFCSCVSNRMTANCGTDLCKQKLLRVQDDLHCIEAINQTYTGPWPIE
jgi:hypothetical protein